VVLTNAEAEPEVDQGGLPTTDDEEEQWLTTVLGLALAGLTHGGSSSGSPGPPWHQGEQRQ
jgi:hypothetical protein